MAHKRIERVIPAAATFLALSVSVAEAAERAPALVEAALHADAVGDAGQPPFAAADRWRAGQLRVGDEWLPLEEAIEQARDDKHYPEYDRRRGKARYTLADQAAMARWCEKHGLAGPARAHWLHVLRIAPGNRAALNALNAAIRNRTLVSREQADAIDARRAETRARRRELKRDYEGLRNDLVGDDPVLANEALDTIDGISDPLSVAMLVHELSGINEKQHPQVAEALHHRLLEAVGRVNQPWAARLLAGQAVAPAFDSIRERAVELLATWPLTETAPHLLAQMRMPLELSVETRRTPDGKVVSAYDEYSEGPAGNDYEYSYDYQREIPGNRYQFVPVGSVRTSEGYTIPERTVTAPTVIRTCGGSHNDPEFPVAVIPETTVPTTYSFEITGYALTESPWHRYASEQTLRSANNRASYYRSEVTRRNQRSAARNQRIAEALEKLTGEELSDYPRDAWQWWQDKHDDNPEWREDDRLSLGLGLVERHPAGVAVGTPVWTRTGLRPIEQLKVGDEVLSQHPATGEVAFKPVLNLVTAEERPMREITLNDSRSVAVARGQWVWSVGEGWRLASDLRPGAGLHGHNGSPAVREQQPGSVSATVALVVDDFATYFIGARSVLVHDATHPTPSDANIPGETPSGEQLAQSGD